MVLPRTPAGLTPEEERLWLKLYQEWDPERCVVISSIHTGPLSETAEAAIRQLADERGMVVGFPELPDPRDPDVLPPIHTVYAVRTTPQ